MALSAAGPGVPILIDFAWYDSRWLTSFARAKQYIARHCPQRLEEFDSAFARLRTAPDFKVQEIMPLFDAATHQQLKDCIASLDKAGLEFHEIRDFGRLIFHDHPLVTELQHQLTPRVCEWVGELVEPSYNFLSLYSDMGICEPHMDAPSAKWTVDYCIEQSAPWPIYFSAIQPWPEQWLDTQDNWEQRVKQAPGQVFTPHVLQEQQALVFSGSSQWHYRDAMPRLHQRNFCHLVFFHYIPAGMRPLTEPENWAELFGIAALNALVIPEKQG